jgi:hypothetical protein
MGTMGTAVGVIAGFLSTLALAYGICYAAGFGASFLLGPGMIPLVYSVGFTGAPWYAQLETVFAGVLLNITQAYILAPILWLVGGLIGGLLTRDAVRGVAAGLIAAILAALVGWIVAWYTQYGLDIGSLIEPELLNLVLLWVLNGILAGIIAAVGGVIGGTLTSQRELR